jgi:hypothetical protein
MTKGEVVEGHAAVESDRGGDAVLNTGANLKTVWLNGAKVFDSGDGGRWTGWHAGKERIPVRLRAGRNTIVIEAKFNFFLSVTEALDWPLPAGAAPAIRVHPTRVGPSPMRGVAPGPGVAPGRSATP